MLSSATHQSAPIPSTLGSHIAPPYVGNGAYCYANSTTMLLTTIGEHIAPSTIEVLTGVGLGASLLAGGSEIFFSNLGTAPDIGIGKALEILGFTCEERAHDDGADAPFDELRDLLSRGPVILGPVDMGHLTYVPHHREASGSDHFVLAFAIDDREIHQHDPAGYPYVSLPLADLAQAWRAERISYRRSAYRSWTAPQRHEHPDATTIYTRARKWFQACYDEADAISAEQRYGPWLNAQAAISRFVENIQRADVSPQVRGHLVYFALPLGAKRALDYAAFFDAYEPNLAALKRHQAHLFGQSYTHAVRSRWEAVAAILTELADVEAAFRTALV